MDHFEVTRPPAITARRARDPAPAVPAAPAGPTAPAAHAAPATPAAPAITRSAPIAAGLLSLQALALQHERFEPAAAAVLAELARQLGCERIALGWHQGHRVRLAALSSGEADAQANLSGALEAAMNEALDQHTVVLHPLPRSASHVLAHAHGELARLNGGLPICTQPVVTATRVAGALLCERRAGFDAATLCMLEDAAQFVGPLLELMHRLDSPLAGRLKEAVLQRGVRLGRRSFARWQVGLALAALAAAAAAFVPMSYDVVAPTRLEGAEQRIVAAPADGYVARAAVRPGDAVKAGQLLVQLEERDQALQRDRWAAEIGQADKQYRETLTRDEPAAIALARAKLEQAQAQFALAERELQRTRLTAPIDGVVISGDLSQSAGMPVQRGQALLTVAPALQLKIVAEVDEQDLPELRVGQKARVLFAALMQPAVPFTVTRIAPVAVTLEGRNVFEVEGSADAAHSAALRPGQRGIARIEIERRLVAEVFWQRAAHALRRLSWRLLG